MAVEMIAEMLRRLSPLWKSHVWPVSAILILAGLVPSRAQEVTANEEVIKRYEQILERAPMEGPSFDKLLQIYQEGEGLEKLDARWAPLSAQSEPKGATYSLLRGLLADRMAKTDEARHDLQAATQAQPDDFHGWLALGDFEVRQGKWADAISALQKGLGTSVTGEDRLSLYRKLGQAQERNLDMPAALATWQKMVEEFPKDQFALEEAGAAELDAEQFDEAKKTFQKLVDLTEPNSMNRVQALMRLAEVDDRQGKTDEAVHDYEAILPLTADSSWLNRELRAQIEQVYRRQDDLAGLVAYYRKWTTDHPKDVEALLLLSATLTELGRKDDALDVLRKVTVLAPDRHEVRESFAQGLVEAKQYDEAITALNALTADDPTEPRYWATLGDALWLKTQPPTPESKKAVLDAWAHIAPADSKDVAAILEVADLCRDHGLNGEALAGYQRALVLTPDASDIREKAVKLLVDTKRPDDAWRLLDQMTDGNLATAANYLKLSTLDVQFERKDAAAEAIQKGLAIEPGNFDLLSQQWSLLAEAQKWTDCIALFDKLVAAAPNPYFIDQLEARQIQALTSAGQLDETAKRLHTRLGADPGLSEGELRMLLRIMIQQSDPEVSKALDESHRRFPQSLGIARIEVDYERHQGNFDAAVSSLQHLVETAPAQKNEWLGDIVRVRQDQGNFDEALKTAGQIIAASPTSADGYLMYADIAIAVGKSEDAVAKLQAAIKLSDKPNDIRQRLARYYLENGQAGKARTIYDEAFAAAENPQDKLTIVRAMTPAYFQDGRVEELINRFKKEQGSEEGGWKYGLYLSAIDEQMEDFGAARRELAKSLAVRPQDTGLLHSLISLAEKEGDSGGLLKYREMLATADPSSTNEIALANEYAIQGKPELAWQIVQKNQGDVAKDPLAWKDILNQMSDPEYTHKIKGVLEQAIRSKGDSFEGEFALVQFQLQQGDLDGAKGSLWNILAQPLPPAPPQQPAIQTTTAKPVRNIFGFGSFQGPIFQRASQSYVALNEIQQLLAPAQPRGQLRSRMGMMRGMFGQTGVPTTLDPVAIKDHALVYLSFIAVQQKQPDEFLKELETKLDAWHWPLSEKLIAYALIQAREPLLQAIEEETKSATPDPDLDAYCFMLCQQFVAQAQNADDDVSKRATAAQDLLGQRLGKDPHFKNMVAMMEITRLSGDVTSDAVAKRKTAIDDYLKTIDRKNPDELIGAIGICTQGSNWDEIKKAVDDLAATDRAKWTVTTTQQLNYLPIGLLQQANATKDVMVKEGIPLVMQLIQMGYPTTPPGPAMTATATTQMQIFGRGFYNVGTFPPPNRYFGPDRTGVLESMFQQLKARGLVTDVYTALDQQEKDLTDWRRIYPELMRIYFQWWDGKHDDAIASVRKLLKQDPSDDSRLLLAAMLAQEQKYDDAIPVLESISARYGPNYIHTQMQLLHTARLAKNNDAGQKAGLKLLALHLPQQEQMQIMDDLRNVGLGAKADEITAKQNNRGLGAGVNQIFQANYQLIQKLNDAVNRDDESAAVDAAHQILNHDPLAANPYGNEDSLRSQALSAIKKFGQLEGYVNDVEKQLRATPDSVRLNWLAAEAYQAVDGHVERTIGLAAVPHWLKLQRTGNKIEASYSLDGSTWISVGNTSIDLPARACIGFWVAPLKRGPPIQAIADQISFTGKMNELAAAPLADAGTNAASAVPLASTNAETNPAAIKVPAPSTDQLPAPWQQSNIGNASQPGSVHVGTDGALTLTGSLEPKNQNGEGAHYVYQMLDGDGGMVARLNQTTGSMDSRLETVGIMIRESVDPGSRAFVVALDPGRGIDWRFRNKTASSLWIEGTPNQPRESSDWGSGSMGEFALPLWLKLERKDNTFTGSTSVDGKKWIEVFSREALMGPDARVGLISSSDREEESPAVWADVKVTPLPAPDNTAPPATASPANTLPPPWEFIEIGDTTIHGRAQGGGSDLTLKPSGPITTGIARNYSFVYQTVHGDGGIIARLTEPKLPGNLYHNGLCFRSRLDKNAPEIELFQFNINRLGYYISSDTAAESLKYFKRVAELAPKNQSVLLTIAEQLRRAGRPRDATDIYLSIFKTDLSTAMTQANNALPAFEATNRLPEFLSIIQNWTPPPPSPMGGGADMYIPLIQAGNTLRQDNHLPEAEQLYRKALSIDTFQSKQDGVAALVQVLMDQDKRDDAGAEIEKWLLDGDSSSAPTPPPILGFNYQMQHQNNWLQSMGSNQYGVVVPPIVHFLELADELGLSAKLRQELTARADKNVTSKNGQINIDRATAILLAIVSRDPTYRADVEKLLKDYAATSTSLGTNANAFLILGEVLEKWPQERPMALRLVSAVYRSPQINQNSYLKNIAGYQMLQIAQAMGDHKTAQATLADISKAMREQRAVNVNQVSIEQVLMVAHWMIQEKMLKDAEGLLADAKTDPQLANNVSYYQQKIDQVQNELSFAKGEGGSLALNYGVASKIGKNSVGTQIFWQVNAGVKTLSNNGNPYFSNTSWDENEGLRPTSYKLDIAGGPDSAHLTHFASWEHVATQGTATLKVPPGVNVVRASLFGTKPGGTTSASPTPASIAPGHDLLLGGPENLIKNPDFQAVKNPSGKMEISGWHGLAFAGVTQETGGPLPAGSHQAIESSYGPFGGGGTEITSDRIPIQPDKNYVLGCWLRIAGTMGIRYRDASGTLLDNHQFGVGGNEEGWRWCAYLLGQDTNHQSGIWPISAKAATVEIYFRPNQGFDIAGLSLREWPAPVATPAADGQAKSASTPKPASSQSN